MLADKIKLYRENDSELCSRCFGSEPGNYF